MVIVADGLAEWQWNVAVSRGKIASSMYVTATISQPIASRRFWPPALRFGFRLTFVYAALYLLPQWLFLLIRALNWVPGAAGLGNAFQQAWQSIDVLVARH